MTEENAPTMACSASNDLQALLLWSPTPGTARIPRAQADGDRERVEIVNPDRRKAKPKAKHEQTPSRTPIDLGSTVLVDYCMI